MSTLKTMLRSIQSLNDSRNTPIEQQQQGSPSDNNEYRRYADAKPILPPIEAFEELNLEVSHALNSRLSLIDNITLSPQSATRSVVPTPRDLSDIPQSKSLGRLSARTYAWRQGSARRRLGNRPRIGLSIDGAYIPRKHSSNGLANGLSTRDARRRAGRMDQPYDRFSADWIRDLGYLDLESACQDERECQKAVIQLPGYH